MNMTNNQRRPVSVSEQSRQEAHKAEASLRDASFDIESARESVERMISKMADKKHEAEQEIATFRFELGEIMSKLEEVGADNTSEAKAIYMQARDIYTKYANLIRGIKPDVGNGPIPAPFKTEASPSSEAKTESSIKKISGMPALEQLAVLSDEDLEKSFLANLEAFNDLVYYKHPKFIVDSNGDTRIRSIDKDKFGEVIEYIRAAVKDPFEESEKRRAQYETAYQALIKAYNEYIRQNEVFFNEAKSSKQPEAAQRSNVDTETQSTTEKVRATQSAREKLEADTLTSAQFELLEQPLTELLDGEVDITSDNKKELNLLLDQNKTLRALESVSSKLNKVGITSESDYHELVMIAEDLEDILEKYTAYDYDQLFAYYTSSPDDDIYPGLGKPKDRAEKELANMFGIINRVMYGYQGKDGNVEGIVALTKKVNKALERYERRNRGRGGQAAPATEQPAAQPRVNTASESIPDAVPVTDTSATESSNSENEVPTSNATSSAESQTAHAESAPVSSEEGEGSSGSPEDERITQAAEKARGVLNEAHEVLYLIRESHRDMLYYKHQYEKLGFFQKMGGNGRLLRATFKKHEQNETDLRKKHKKIADEFEGYKNAIVEHIYKTRTNQDIGEETWFGEGALSDVINGDPYTLPDDAEKAYEATHDISDSEAQEMSFDRLFDDLKNIYQYRMAHNLGEPVCNRVESGAIVPYVLTTFADGDNSIGLNLERINPDQTRTVVKFNDNDLDDLAFLAEVVAYMKENKNVPTDKLLHKSDLPPTDKNGTPTPPPLPNGEARAEEATPENEMVGADSSQVEDEPVGSSETIVSPIKDTVVISPEVQKHSADILDSLHDADEDINEILNSGIDQAVESSTNERMSKEWQQKAQAELDEKARKEQENKDKARKQRDELTLSAVESLLQNTDQVVTFKLTDKSLAGRTISFRKIAGNQFEYQIGTLKREWTRYDGTDQTLSKYLKNILDNSIEGIVTERTELTSAEQSEIEALITELLPDSVLPVAVRGEKRKKIEYNLNGTKVFLSRSPGGAMYYNYQGKPQQRLMSYQGLLLLRDIKDIENGEFAQVEPPVVLESIKKAKAAERLSEKVADIAMDREIEESLAEPEFIQDSYKQTVAYGDVKNQVSQDLDDQG